MLTKREEIFLKLQSDASTVAAPDADNAILVEDLDYSYEGTRMAEFNPRKPTLGKEQSLFAGALISITFNIKVKGSGTAGSAPEFGDALIACGMSETIVASTSVTYAPASTGHKFATIYYYKDGKLQKATGCKGTWEFSGNVGESGVISFTFTGHDGGQTDASLVGGNYDATVPPVVIGADFSVGSFSPVISAFSISIGNEIATPPNMNSDDGYADIIIQDRDVSGSFDPEDTLKATQDWIGTWKAGTTAEISTGEIGSTAGNIWELDVAEAYYKELGNGDRDGVRTLDVGFGALGDDSSLALKFT